MLRLRGLSDYGLALSGSGDGPASHDELPLYYAACSERRSVRREGGRER